MDVGVFADTEGWENFLPGVAPGSSLQPALASPLIHATTQGRGSGANEKEVSSRLGMDI